MTPRLSEPYTVSCPACGGCLPGDGPDHEVCLCGSTWDRPGLVPSWVPSMRQLIGTLAELLTNPGPPDEPLASVKAVASQTPTQDHRSED